MPNSAPLQTGVRAKIKHDSADKHVSGSAYYIDDLPEAPGLLHIYIAQSPHAHAKILSMDLTAVAQQTGVHAVLSAKDVIGKNDVGPVLGGDPIFAETLVEYAGQSLFAVAAETVAQARTAAKFANIDYEVLEPIVTVRQALEKQSFVLDSKTFRRGEPEHALANAPLTLAGEIEIGGQDHFYLESQVAMAIPGEDTDFKIYSSTQHPSEVQHACAKALKVPDNSIQVEVRRMGGGFGGKESQPALFASIAALVSYHTGRAAKVRMDRDDDMIMTGKRHDYLIKYQIGFDQNGLIHAARFEAASRCGMSPDLSASINDRTMFHLDNAYYLDNVEIVSHRCKTHTVSNTAFRGFGGPQGMVAIERVIDEIAYRLNKDPIEIRQLNFYGKTDRNITPYHMPVTDNIIPEIADELLANSDYFARMQAVKAFNQQSPYLKKGLALTPVKFGISFTATHLNQAGALVHIYTDGSIHLNHGGTEMGQGLFTKVAQIVAEEFQVEVERIKITATTTDKVPNTSPTAASSGCDLNGKAAQNAAHIIKQRLIDFAAEHYAVDAASIQFTPQGIQLGYAENQQIVAFDQLILQAYLARVSLSSTGFYSTPKIHFDQTMGQGHPFFYFAYGAAVSEVTVDTLTGEYKVNRVDILHDCGDSINPVIDKGQVEGGFIQGMGWLTTEELFYDVKGQLRTHAPSTYKIPACGDRPAQMNIQLRCEPNPEDTVFRSKAVGEPPLMLGISVFNAINHAVASLADYQVCPKLNAPATPENVLKACLKLQTTQTTV